MFLTCKPSYNDLSRFLKAQDSSAFSYSDVGLTLEERAFYPDWYSHRVKGRLGRGEQVFERAISAIKHWQHFAVGWAKLFPTMPPLVQGTNLIVYAQHGPLWSINPCRIIYTIDHAQKGIRRFGYGYGTLLGHSETGEERFLIEWNHIDHLVSFEIFALIRPQHPLVKILWPVSIAITNEFRKQSLRTLQNTLLL